MGGKMTENMASFRFILQSFLLNKYLRYTLSVYPILILGLGAMFTRSYRVSDLSANTVYCGKMPIECRCTFRNDVCLFSLFFLTLCSLIFRFPYGPGDHHELFPFGLWMFAQGEFKKASCDWALYEIWKLWDSVPACMQHRTQTSEVTTSRNLSVKSDIWTIKQSI